MHYIGRTVAETWQTDCIVFNRLITGNSQRRQHSVS